MTEEKEKLEEGSTTEDTKIYAAVGYIFILCLIPLLLKKDDEFARFHGKQGLVLCICEIAALFFSVIPKLGETIWLVSAIAFPVLALAGIVQSLKGNRWKMPIVGEIADKISL